MKTVEELLKPRYKVIADYPKSIYNVGVIINAGTTSEDCIYCDREGPRMRHYPHLFQPLPWWSDRSVEDMPQFVKSIKQEYDHGVAVGNIIKVKEWVLLSETMYVIQSKTREYHPSCFVPATREEYELYKQQKKP